MFCKKCQERKATLKRVIVYPIQRFLRKITGTERWIVHNRKEHLKIMMSGAKLEKSLRSHEISSAFWMGEMEKRISQLESRVFGPDNPDGK